MGSKSIEEKMLYGIVLGSSTLKTSLLGMSQLEEISPEMSIQKQVPVVGFLHADRIEGIARAEVFHAPLEAQQNTCPSSVIGLKYTCFPFFPKIIPLALLKVPLFSGIGIFALSVLILGVFVFR